MEPLELSSALLQPQVTVVAILGELVTTLPSQDKMLFWSPSCLYWDLEFFTRELWLTLYRIDDPWWRQDVTSDGDDPPTSLSQALAAYKSIPWIAWLAAGCAAGEWLCSVSALVNRWARLARAATELRSAWREVANKAADRAATATPWARELQAEAARYGTAQENRVKVGQALGGEEGDEVVARQEAQVRREAMMAASWATTATMERQQMEAALGLLERLVAACDEATVFPQELQRLLRDTLADPKETKKQSTNVPEDLVDEAAQLWEANTRLVKDHLLGTLQDIIDFYFTGAPTRLSACEVAERCQRAIEDIPRLVQPPEHPQSAPKISAVSMEPQKLSPALLQPQVTVVATLGELLATLPRWDEEMLLPMSLRCLYRDLEEFTEELQYRLYCTDNPWWHRSGTFDDDDLPISLSQALAAYKSTPWTSWKRVTVAASEWQGSVAELVDRWAQLARAATELGNTCREVANEASDMVVTATAQARELQDNAALDGTAQENMVELGQALAGEEGAEVVARQEAWVRRDAWVAASKARRATMVRQRVEASLGLLERLVAACDEAAAFPLELQRRVRDIKAALKGTNEAPTNVPEALVAKVAVAERLWEANACLVKDHLADTLCDIFNFAFDGGPFILCEVAKRCQRAFEDIPRLIRPPEDPCDVPKVFPVSMELQEPQVSIVAALGELLATLPRGRETLPMSQGACPGRLQEHPMDHLGCVTMAASMWQWSVSVLGNSWVQLARAATKLPYTCREVATEAADMVATATAWARELQDEVAHYGTGQKNMVELGQALGRKEGAEALNMHEAWVWEEAREAASRARRATMVRQRVEVALGLLERLVAACDEAAMFPRELQRRVGDIVATLKGTNEASPNVPEALVAKVAVAEWLWEANARLAKGHLLGAVPDTIKFYFDGCPDSPSACGVAERCQRAIEDIPSLLHPLECPQGVPKVSPGSMELQELSPLQLQALVAVVATLGEVVATVTGPHREKFLHESSDSLHEDLKNSPGAFMRSWTTAVSPPWPPCVRAAASAWWELVARLVDRWDWLARVATELHDNHRKVVMEQHLLGALDKEEVAREMATHDAQVVSATNEAMAEAGVATRRGHWAVMALGLLQRLVATCDRATLFNWNMECQLKDIEAILKGTNEMSPDVLQALVAKVAKFEGSISFTAGGSGGCGGHPGQPVSRHDQATQGQVPAQSPNSLHEDMRRLTWSLCRTVNHGSVTSLGHPGVPSLGRALATLRESWDHLGRCDSCDQRLAE
ncbi:uncharacterized protein LOC108963779, partial [Serinus canaria]|uniref:uncharacterized protein LOC108963779 n=1 Tax=Serinus canaria TaxID=9135 RepID=UPI0021CC792A